MRFQVGGKPIQPVLKPDEVSTSGVLIYLNVEDRIKDAVAQVEKCGGKVTEAAPTVFVPSLWTVRGIAWPFIRLAILRRGCRAGLLGLRGNARIFGGAPGHHAPHP